MLNSAMLKFCLGPFACISQKLSICIYLVLLNLSIHAQWQIYSYVEHRKYPQDLLAQLPSTVQQSGFVFFGNSESHLDNVHTIGHALSLSDATAHPTFNKYTASAYWQAAVSKPLLANDINPLYLSINLFTENVKTYIMAIHDKAGVWRIKKVECKTDRYQLPQELMISPKNFAASTEVTEQNAYQWQIDSLAFLVTAQYTQQPIKFVLGEYQVYQKQISKRPAKASFFYEFTQNPAYQLESHIHRQFGNQYPLAQVTSFTGFGPNQYYLEYPIGATDSLLLEKQTLSFIAYTIKKYPYYKEHQLNKAAVFARVDSILQAKVGFYAKLQAYRKMIAGFNDAHFYFEAPVPKGGVYPLIAKNINGVITVAGVIDPELNTTILPGMEIISIAGVPVRQYIDSLANYFAGDARLKWEMAISRLFSTINGNPLSITLKDNEGALFTTTISYSKKLNLPPNFRSEHFRYTSFENRTSYLRLTRWNHGDWVNFFNLGEDLAKQESIIFDLRGNSGGQELDMMQIAACFFKRPTPLLFNTYQSLQAGKGELSGESIVTPNLHLRLQHLKIRILTDARTGCASEMFIKLLQRSGANIKVVASENTTGSYAHLAEFVLPYNIVLHTNVMANSYLNKKKETIEYSGIAPDIKVPLASYKDLYPYDDKLLQTALDDLTNEKIALSSKR